MMAEYFETVLTDFATGEEIEIGPLHLVVKPNVGEEIHYWQDGFPDNAGVDSGIRRDFMVRRIRHDVRFIPARGTSQLSRSRYVHTLECFVHELRQRGEDDPVG